MKPSYLDILDRIHDEPSYHDQHGCPRWGDFSPEVSSSVYAENVVLLRIACQLCKKEFLVEMSWDRFLSEDSVVSNLEDWLRKEGKDRLRRIPMHYGDPPYHECHAGETMNCIDLKIEQFWHRDHFEWKRIEKYEVELDSLENYKHEEE